MLTVNAVSVVFMCSKKIALIKKDWKLTMWVCSAGEILCLAKSRLVLVCPQTRKRDHRWKESYWQETFFYFTIKHYFNARIKRNDTRMEILWTSCRLSLEMHRSNMNLCIGLHIGKNIYISTSGPLSEPFEKKVCCSLFLHVWPRQSVYCFIQFLYYLLYIHWLFYA